MQTIIQTAYGSPSVLQLATAKKPEPKSNELLVRIKASSVTTADAMMRRGTPLYGRLLLGLTKPRYQTPGTGFSGVVESVGAAVTQFKTGDPVMGESVLGSGTNCDYVCIKEDGVITQKPDNISHAQAAPIGDGVMTSYQFLNIMTTIKPGDRVLINGAAGSLGSAAVQIARQAGAKVTGVCSQSNAEYVRALGAETVLDYKKENPLAAPQTYDLIYDSVGKLNCRQALRTLTPTGCYQSPVLALDLLLLTLWYKLRGSHRVMFSATGLLPEKTRRELLIKVKKQIARGHIKLMVDREYPLENLAEAHAYVDTGHKRGNIVVIN